ncbi:MAG: RnfABCDGE type electron transport complex subunit D [Oscillospiraceae bacterium]
MRDVLIALLPAVIARVASSSGCALLVVAVTTAACVFFEWGFEKLCHTPSTISDLSAAVTGVLLAMNLPVSIPLWQAVFGALVAIVAVKGLFGGIGKNFANPAITARIVMFLAFSKTMTAWVFPDAVSSATPLAMMANGESVDYLTLLLGNHGGCLGETSALALLIGFAYLLIRGVISWHTPVCFVGTVFVISLILGQDAVGQIFSGGLMLGAIFMATDYSTTPSTNWAKSYSVSARAFSRCSSASTARMPGRFVRHPLYEHPHALSVQVDGDETVWRCSGMSEKQGIIKAVVVLVVICLVISGALAVVNSFTAPVSAANAEARETAARQELIPEAGSFEQVTDGLPENVLSAYVGKAADGSVAGYVITTSGKGFGGTIQVMVAISGGNDPSLQDAGRFQRNEDARRPDGKRELLWPV